MPKIVIEDFGPLVKVELEIQDFILFIGPQASGKSTLAKLIYFFKTLPNDFYQQIEAFSLPQYFYDALQLTIYNKFAQHFQYYTGSVTFYLSDTEYFQFTATGFTYSDSIQKVLLEIEQLLKKEAAYMKRKEHKRKIPFKKLAQLLNLSEENLKNQPTCFIPAARGGLFSISAQVQSLLLGAFSKQDADNFLDPITLQFMTRWELIKQARQGRFLMNLSRLPVQRQTAIELLSRFSEYILKGKYEYTANEHFLDLTIGTRIPLRSASSGQQEAVAILEYMLLALRDIKKIEDALLVVEEPEAHLYPISQYEMVKAISLFANELPNTQIVLTTHSPYILTALNNLLFASETIAKYPQTQPEIEPILPKSCWLNTQKVGAYYVAGGKIASIIEKSNLIGENELDDASDNIMNDFDAMMDLYKKYQPKKMPS
jgi:AAA15 family ATPase/GTPase